MKAELPYLKLHLLTREQRFENHHYKIPKFLPALLLAWFEQEHVTYISCGFILHRIEYSKKLHERLIINLPFLHLHVGKVHRLGKPKENKPRPVIVRFNAYRYRNAVYLRRRDMSLTQSVYVNECLTKKRAHIFFRC